MVEEGRALCLLLVHISPKCLLFGLCSIFWGGYVLVGEKPKFVVVWCSWVYVV
jgi:hypothetical protein